MLGKAGWPGFLGGKSRRTLLRFHPGSFLRPALFDIRRVSLYGVPVAAPAMVIDLLSRSGRVVLPVGHRQVLREPRPSLGPPARRGKVCGSRYLTGCGNELAEGNRIIFPSINKDFFTEG